MGTRLERVVLEMDDRLSTPMAMAAAKTALLRRELDDLNGTAVRTSVSTDRLSRDVEKTDSAFKRGAQGIDLYSGRLRLVATAGLALGPSILPVVAGLTPAVSGLATGIAGAAGVAAAAGLAFAGVGTALDALNTFQVEPTADNFLALQAAMDELGPSGERLVRYLDSISGEIETLQRIAGDNAFPGITEGIDEILELTPRAQRMVAEFATRLGDLAADGGASLAGEQWEDFFTFLETDAAPIFDQLARATGNVALGLANMTAALAPLSRDFASGMLEASRSFAAWSADSSNFEDFIEYVRAVGPQVTDFLGSLASAGVAVTQALAPWGSVVLPAMTVLLDLFTAVAGSPIGPALTTAALAMLTFNKAAAAGTAIMGRVGPAFGGARASIGQMRADLGTVASGWVLASSATDAESKKMAAATDRLKSNMAAVGKGAGVLGAVGVAASGAAVGVGLQNTAMLGLAGTMAGPWGAAAGAGVGLILDFKAAQDAAAESARSFSDTLDSQSGALTAQSTTWLRDQFKPSDLAALNEAGIGVEELTTAILGGADAYKEFADANNLQTTTNGIGWLTRNGADEASINMYKLAQAVDDGQSAFDLLGPAIDDSANSAAAATRSLAELTAAQQAQTQASLEAIDAGTRYGAALDKAKDQADAGTKGLSKYTEAGRANRDALSQLVASYNDQDAATKNSVQGYERITQELGNIGREMGLSAGQIKAWQSRIEQPAELRVKTDAAQKAILGARQAFQSLPGHVMTELATKGVPRTEAQVDALVKKYRLTEEQRTALITLKDLASAGIGDVIHLIHNVKGKTVTLKVDGSQAKGEVGAVQAVINSLSGKTVTVTTYQRTIYAAGKMASIADAQGKADGGEVLGQRYPYGDKVIVALAPGEEVISNRYGQADAFRRDRAAGRIPAYADGGTITLPGYAGGGKVAASLYSGLGNDKRSYAEWDRIVKALDRHGKALDRAAARTERAIDRQEKAIDRTTNRLQDFESRRDEVRTSVRTSLTRDWLGDGNQDPWSAGAQQGTVAFANQEWAQQTADAKQLAALIANLRKNGAGDAFVAQILNSRDPLAAAKMFNSESKASLMNSQKLFTDATRYTNAAANAGGAIYNDDIRGVRNELVSLNKGLLRLEKQLDRQHNQAEATRKKESAAKSAARGARSKKKS